MANIEQPRPIVIPAGFDKSVEETLPDIVERMVQVLRPEKIVLFGSYACGEETPDSDVDLFVVMETDATSVGRYTAVSNIMRPRSFPVDIVVSTPTELREQLATNHFFIREILTTGKVLYESSSKHSYA